MSTSVPTGGLVHDFRGGAHGKKQLPRPSSTSVSAAVVGVVGGVSGVDSRPFLNSSLRAIFPERFALASFTFTFVIDSAESERVERTDILDKDRRRAGMCSRGAETSGVTGAVTS